MICRRRERDKGVTVRPGGDRLEAENGNLSPSPTMYKNSRVCNLGLVLFPVCCSLFLNSVQLRWSDRGVETSVSIVVHPVFPKWQLWNKY